MMLADPVGSVLAPLVKTGADDRGRQLGGGRHRRGFHAAESPISRWCSEAYSISDAESFAAARELLREEGILAGSSSGTLLAAALRYCRAQTEPKRVVTLVCDTGAKYLSKVFNDAFLAQEGWIQRSAHGTVRDRRHQPLRRGHRGRGAAGRHSAHRVRAHARRRRLAAAGGRRATASSASSTRATCSARC